MKLKKTTILCALALLPLSACSAATIKDPAIEEPAYQVTSTISVDYSAKDLSTTYLEESVQRITLNGTSINADGSNLSVNGAVLTISGAGDYYISGSLTNGQILIVADKEDTVHLFFDDVSITNTDGSPFVVLNADKVIVTLMENSLNSLVDGISYALTGEDDPDATLYAKDDLTINGTGTLSIISNSNIGIHESNDLKIIDATVTVESSLDGIKGKDSVSLKDAIVSITTDEDGIQSTNSVDQGKGYISVDGGSLKIDAGLDGIQAESQVLISSGVITIDSGREASAEQSGKGIKAVLDLSINAGNLTITSHSEDTLNSQGTLSINGGQLTLDAKDDAIHADDTLVINGGEINILTSYEGLEAATLIINEGIIHLNALDDGINTSTGTIAYVKGGANMNHDDGSTLTINGGSIYVNALGDGVDSNGSITMNGGTLIAFGPTDTKNGTLDYNITFTLTGGTIVAVGSSGMAQQASTSDINSVMVNLDSSLPSGTLISVVDSSGKVVVAFETIKSAANFVFASETFAKGTYTVYSGGTLSTTFVDHVAFNGTLSNGTVLTTFIVSSTLTSSGAAQSGPGGNTKPGGNLPPRK